jgi:hypothetical protein
MFLDFQFMSQKKFGRIRTSREAEKAIQKIHSKIPEPKKVMRASVKQASKMFQGIFPSPGGPGRTPMFSALQKRQICSIIGTFLANGMTLKTAFGEVAKQYKMSFRTTRRVWEGRPY